MRANRVDMPGRGEREPGGGTLVSEGGAVARLVGSGGMSRAALWHVWLTYV